MVDEGVEGRGGLTGAVLPLPVEGGFGEVLVAVDTDVGTATCGGMFVGVGTFTSSSSSCVPDPSASNSASVSRAL